MSEKPNCFGWVNESKETQEARGHIPVKECKTCDLLTDCIGAYNQRVYDHWSYDHEYDSPDPDFQDDEDFHDLDFDWEPDPEEDETPE